MNTKTKTIGLFAIALLALTALVGSAQALQPDLTVSSITVNPGDTRADELVRFYVNENNAISAVVCNNGGEAAGAFDVCFDADNANIGCEEVASLAAGTCIPVSIEWTPSCEKYLVMPGYPAQALPITITVTADCNCENCPNCPEDGSNGKIGESEEVNNALEMIIPTIQYWTHPTSGVKYPGIAGVVNNGYKSKNFDCNLIEEPLTQFEYDGEIVGGGIAYDVSGAKITLKEEETSERVHHIDIPDGATVKKARLYLYWYDGWGNFYKDPHGYLADLMVDFNGATYTMPDAMYNDQKGLGAWHSPKGTYAYDVTSEVSGSGDYTVIITNGREKTTLLGEMLYVVYEGASCGQTIQLWTLEGNDYLMASHGIYQYSVSVEESTATVAFPGTIEDLTKKSARLITVVAQGQEPGSNMLFNGVNIKTDAWDSPTEAYPGSKINIESVDVTANLAASGNNMGFQDTGTAGMQASNAFLIVEYYIPVDIDIRPNSCPNPLHLRSKGVLPVAILGTEDFDVTTVDPATILLTREGFEGDVAPIRWSYKDVATPFTGELCDCHDLNGDGYLDLTLKFESSALISTLALSPEETILTLTGNLKAENGGKPIRGEDCIWVLE